MTIRGHLKFSVLLFLTIRLSYDPQLLPTHSLLLSLTCAHHCAADTMQILSLSVCSYTPSGLHESSDTAQIVPSP